MLFKNSKIPRWITFLQLLLTLIMVQQAFLFTFDHQSVLASGITLSGIPDLNLFYEFASRTFVMAIISLFAIITQNPHYFLVVLLTNILREGFETIIDPLFPLANAPMSPTGDFILYVVIVLIEIWAFVTILKIVRKLEKA
tara:strand:+ start:780 stop:1202 length:423 start_codon:yes stop_codon:yes gene_type:complete